MGKLQLKVLFIILALLKHKVSAKCRLKPLSTKSQMPGDTIVSGTVKSFYMKETGGAFAGRVKVRRVFKGDKGLEGRMVMIEGLGSKTICLSSPRLGDTKLFFMQTSKLRQNIYPRVYKFKLRDNILKLNLKNLKVLWKLEDGTKQGKIV